MVSNEASSISPDTTTYLISGTNRGLGLELVKQLAQRNNTLIYAGVRDPNKATELNDLAKTNSNIRVIPLSANSEQDNANAVSTIEKEAGRIDVLIANAGIANYLGKAHETPLDEMRQHYEVNVLGVLALFQATLPLLLKAKIPKFAVISSGAGSITRTEVNRLEVTAYGCSKAAVNYMTRKIHFEQPQLITLPMSPGWVSTDMGSRTAKRIGKTDGMIDVQTSVSGMLSVIDKADKENYSGRFWSYEEKEMPW